MADIGINARSSIRIEGTKVIYFDPFKITKEKHDADIVFITHEHYDHFSPEDIRKISNEHTILLAPYSMKQLVSEEVENMVSEIKFVNPENMEENLNIDSVLIKWVRAYNIDKPFHVRESGWIGYVVTLDGETYFVTGDTDANDDNVNVKCDVLFVPCGGKYTFDVDEAVEFTRKINPRRVIPTHYTDIAGESEIGKRFESAVQNLVPGIEVGVLL